MFAFQIYFLSEIAFRPQNKQKISADHYFYADILYTIQTQDRKDTNKVVTFKNSDYTIPAPKHGMTVWVEIRYILRIPSKNIEQNRKDNGGDHEYKSNGKERKVRLLRSPLPILILCKIKSVLFAVFPSVKRNPYTS